MQKTLTNPPLPPVLAILLPSRKVHRARHPNPRRDLRRQRHLLQRPDASPRQQPDHDRQLRRRLRRAEPDRAGRPHGPDRLRAPLRRVVPEEPQHLRLLLRRRRHQRQLADRLVRLLPRPQHQPARRQPAHLQRLPAGHHGRLRRRRRQPLPARRRHLRRRRPADQRQLRPGLRQRQHPRRGVARRPRRRFGRAVKSAVETGDGAGVRGARGAALILGGWVASNNVCVCVCVDWVNLDIFI